MAVANTCWFVAGSSGVADFSDGAALTGHRNMAGASLKSGALYSYRAEHPTDKSIWENGRGVAGGGVLTRAVISESSTGAKVNFAVAPVVLLVPMAFDWDLAARGTDFKNRIINPSGRVQQFALAATADNNYLGFDQWLTLTETGSVTPSLQTNAADGVPLMMRLTQSQAAAQRLGFLQWLEQLDCVDLRGQRVCLSALVKTSDARNIRMALFESTAFPDTGISRDIVNNWASGTFTTGNFFINTNAPIVTTASFAVPAGTLTPIELPVTVGSTMNNLAAFIWTEAQAAQNVTLDVAEVQLEYGSVRTPIALLPVSVERVRCQRFGEWVGSKGVGQANSTSQAEFICSYGVEKRVAPTITMPNANNVVEFSQGNRAITSIGGITAGVNAAYIQINTAAAYSNAQRFVGFQGTDPFLALSRL